MTEITPEDLRVKAESVTDPVVVRMLNEAADAIENLRSEAAVLRDRLPVEFQLRENERLRAALQPFSEPHAMGDNYVKFAPRLIEAARAALEPQ